MLGLSSRIAALAAVCALAGCSALINPDSDRLGTDPDVDAGVVMLMDAGPDGFDAGPDGFDAGDMMCREGDRRCAGDALLTCAGGMEIPQDCQTMAAFCQVDHCQPHVCRPNSRECSEDGDSVVSCSARGDSEDVTDCGDARCDPATRTCEGVASCEDATRVRLNIPRTIDLCERVDANTYEPTDMCRSMMRSSSGDQVYVFELSRAARLTMQLTDVDPARAVDTVLYIRRACDEPGTQALCTDDVPCTASTADPPACFGGVDVRQSRVTADFPPGTYYIIVDAFEYRSDGQTFSCGEVELSVTTAG